MKIEQFSPDRMTTIHDSSNIKFISYDPQQKVMSVLFVEGRQYLYAPVSSDIYGAIVSADSVGKKFQELVQRNEAIFYEEFGKVANTT